MNWFVSLGFYYRLARQYSFAQLRYDLYTRPRDWLRKFYFWRLCSGASIRTQNLMRGFEPTPGSTVYSTWLRYMIKTYGDRGGAWDFRGYPGDIGTFEIKFRKQEDLVWYALKLGYDYTGK